MNVHTKKKAVAFEVSLYSVKKVKQSRYRPRGFQEVKVKQSRYRPGVAQRVPGS
jgi:hypothetical protein